MLSNQDMVFEFRSVGSSGAEIVRAQVGVYGAPETEVDIP